MAPTFRIAVVIGARQGNSGNATAAFAVPPPLERIGPGQVAREGRMGHPRAALELDVSAGHGDGGHPMGLPPRLDRIGSGWDRRRAGL